MADITISREMTATPDAIWALVSDLPRMGEWSPENQGGAWIKGATGPAVGARFKGNNKHGAKTWSTIAKVTACAPGKEFGFHVAVGPINVADWHYAIEDLGAGKCRVTESWTERRHPLVQKLGERTSGVADRVETNRSGMSETLRRLDETLAAK